MEFDGHTWRVRLAVVGTRALANNISNVQSQAEIKVR